MRRWASAIDSVSGCAGAVTAMRDWTWRSVVLTALLLLFATFVALVLTLGAALLPLPSAVPGATPASIISNVGGKLISNSGRLIRIQFIIHL